MQTVATNYGYGTLRYVRYLQALMAERVFGVEAYQLSIFYVP